MSEELEPFDFEGEGVRVEMIDGEPWFRAVDPAKILGYRDAANAVRTLRDHQVRTHLVSTPNRPNVSATMISEGGLYRLIMRSNSDRADAFQDWVTDVVLPKLRRGEALVASVPLEAPRTYQDALRAYADALDAKEAAEVQAEIEAGRVRELEPKASLADRWLLSPDTVYIVEWAKHIGLTQGQAFEALRQEGVLFKQEHPGPRGEKRWFNLPKAGYRHLFDIVQERLRNGDWATVPKLNARGQVELAQLLAEEGWLET